MADPGKSETSRLGVSNGRTEWAHGRARRHGASPGRAADIAPEASAPGLLDAHAAAR